MKKNVTTILIILILISNISFSEDITSTDVTVLIDGSKLESIDTEQGVNLPPIIFNNRTMIPLRKTIEAFGIDSSQISWDETEKSVTLITNNFDTIWMQVNNKEIYVNNKKLMNDVPPIIYNNRTYIPTAMISSLLGSIPEWDADTRTVTMTPSTYNLSKFNISFVYPRKSGYIFKDDFLENKSYYFQLNDIENLETTNMLIFTQLNETIDVVLNNYLSAHVLGSDDFSMTSTVPFAYSYEQGHERVTFVRHGEKTIQIVSNGMGYEELIVLIDSINEVE